MVLLLREVELGWMVLPDHQRKGLGKASVQLLLDRARTDGRWGVIHAFPGATNVASNGISKTLGFTLVGQSEVDFAERKLLTNHWIIDSAKWL